MKTFTDQLKRIVNIGFPPKRIISVVPSQTELLFDLGLTDEVVGITKFCIHPNEWFRNKERIGGTKNINIKKVKELQPDLIIANKEENTKDDIESLEKIAPVWISDISNLNEATDMVESVGTIVNKELEAKNIVDEIKLKFIELKNFVSQNKFQNKSCCYLIWQKPYMSIAADTFIHALLQECGLENYCSKQLRYPEIKLEQLIEEKPAIIMLSSEPFPFKQKHIDELQQHLPDTKIVLVDGEMFSWYGSRLIKSPEYFIQLLKSLS